MVSNKHMGLMDCFLYPQRLPALRAAAPSRTGCMPAACHTQHLALHLQWLHHLAGREGREADVERLLTKVQGAIRQLRFLRAAWSCRFMGCRTCWRGTSWGHVLGGIRKQASNIPYHLYPLNHACRGVVVGYDNEDEADSDVYMMWLFTLGNRPSSAARRSPAAAVAHPHHPTTCT